MLKVNKVGKSKSYTDLSPAHTLFVNESVISVSLSFGMNTRIAKFETL